MQILPFACCLLLTPVLLLSGAHWPQFRGPDGRGIGEDNMAPPVEFGPGKNVAWKAAVASGHSSPAIWGDRIFLTTFTNGKLAAVCIDRTKGSELWSRPVPAEKLEAFHRTGSPAASTPATDGERVYFHFGSFGLLCLDFDGNEVWRHSLPLPNNDFGAGASPVVSGGRVIVARDQDMDSFLLALDARTGKTLWRASRPGCFRGHATPFVWRHEQGAEIVLPGSVRLCSYDPETGRELWSATGLSRVANASATSGDGLLFASSWNIGADAGDRIELPPFAEFTRANDKNHDGRLSEAEFPAGPWKSRYTQLDADKDGGVARAEWEAYAPVVTRAENALFAVRPGGKGDITASHVAWKKTRGLPYVPSPLFFEGRIYTVKSGGMASCFDATSGREYYLEERLGLMGDFYASPVAAAGRVYYASQKGTVAVVAAGNDFRVLGRNDLGEPIYATPAIVAGKLYVRTAAHLYCFEGSPEAGTIKP